MHGSDNVDRQMSKRGSNQLSLETPRNGAGTCGVVYSVRAR
jgi:hypothetical protein